MMSKIVVVNSEAYAITVRGCGAHMRRNVRLSLW